MIHTLEQLFMFSNASPSELPLWPFWVAAMLAGGMIMNRRTGG